MNHTAVNLTMILLFLNAEIQACIIMLSSEIFIVVLFQKLLLHVLEARYGGIYL